MNIDDLTPEQKEKVLACKTPEELLALAKQEGYELSEEQLEDISGGAWGTCKDRMWKCQDYSYC
ncbi:MAG: Nif11-like leader peptide family natural product precursor [Eggerthellaceae bacterium]|nr:Nif11-like leader peptide family natural product precursor [Eggerthellaceae bacterium]